MARECGPSCGVAQTSAATSTSGDGRTTTLRVHVTQFLRIEGSRVPRRTPAERSIPMACQERAMDFTRILSLFLGSVQRAEERGTDLPNRGRGAQAGRGGHSAPHPPRRLPGQRLAPRREACRRWREASRSRYARSGRIATSQPPSAALSRGGTGRYASDTEACGVQGPVAARASLRRLLDSGLVDVSARRYPQDDDDSVLALAVNDAVAAEPHRTAASQVSLEFLAHTGAAVEGSNDLQCPRAFRCGESVEPPLRGPSEEGHSDRGAADCPSLCRSRPLRVRPSQLRREELPTSRGHPQGRSSPSPGAATAVGEGCQSLDPLAERLPLP